MKILSFDILAADDVVERVENEQVHVRKKDGTYIVYTLHTENPEFLDFDAFIIKKGDGFLSLKDNADLSDLDSALERDDD